MPRWVSILAQTLGFVVQGVNQFGGFIPPEYHLPIALAVGAAQGVMGIIAHSFNPDGTPATLPYVKPAS
jgi:hypothetical protein